jgi:hypothetical protein
MFPFELCWPLDEAHDAETNEAMKRKRSVRIFFPDGSTAAGDAGTGVTRSETVGLIVAIFKA